MQQDGSVSVSTCNRLVCRLLDDGESPVFRVNIISQATTPVDQRVSWISNFHFIFVGTSKVTLSLVFLFFKIFLKNVVTGSHQIFFIALTTTSSQLLLFFQTKYPSKRDVNNAKMMSHEKIYNFCSNLIPAHATSIRWINEWQRIEKFDQYLHIFIGILEVISGKICPKREKIQFAPVRK